MAAVVSVTVSLEIATLVLDDASDLAVGERVQVYGTAAALGTNKVDGSHVLASVTLGTNTVTYPVNNVDDIATTLTPGAVLTETVTWADVEDLETFLDSGTLSGTELAWAEDCTAAANHWAYHRRLAAGFTDSPLFAPEANVRTAVVLMAAGLFRERGSVDSYQSFEGFSAGAPPVGALGQILRLLRCGRPTVG